MALGPLLGVSWLWTWRSDHAPGTGCVDFFSIYIKKRYFGDISSCLTFSSYSPFIPRNYEKRLTLIFFKIKEMSKRRLSTKTPFHLHRENFCYLLLQNTLDHDNG